MANLDVQPKKQTPWLWIILALVALLVLFFLFRSCNDNDVNETTAIGSDTTTMATDNTTVAATSGWEGINYDAPVATYEEITNTDIEVRGDDNYTIYSLGENILFDTDQSTIRTNAASNLEQISASISKRFGTGDIRVYGYTDAVGSAGYNKELAEERALAVQNWLVGNGKITESRISVHPVGEARPAANNATAEGRQENRRVEIVVKR